MVKEKDVYLVFINKDMEFFVGIDIKMDGKDDMKMKENFVGKYISMVWD